MNRKYLLFFKFSEAVTFFPKYSKVTTVYLLYNSLFSWEFWKTKLPSLPWKQKVIITNLSKHWGWKCNVSFPDKAASPLSYLATLLTLQTWRPRLERWQEQKMEEAWIPESPDCGEFAPFPPASQTVDLLPGTQASYLEHERKATFWQEQSNQKESRSPLMVASPQQPWTAYLRTLFTWERKKNSILI